MNVDTFKLCQMVVDLWKGRDVDETEFEEILVRNKLELCSDCDIVESKAELHSIRDDFKEISELLVKLIQDGEAPELDKVAELINRQDFKIQDYRVVDMRKNEV